MRSINGRQLVNLLQACLCGVCFALASGHTRAEAWLIDVEGAIGPATSDHFIRGLSAAEAAQAELLVLRIDTPGGLDLAMREMIKAILAADIPIVGYVAPSGARAASAGTYILYATHIAAMAPGTNLGAATPVQIGSQGEPGEEGSPQSEDGGSAPAGETSLQRKLVNDAAAYIESLAQLRGRNAEWAVQAVREGASLSANDALQIGVIDIVASSVDGLMRQIDGREVTVGGGTRTLETQDLVIHTHTVDWRSEFLAVITDPNIAYVLMMIGIYGLIIEFYIPGFGLPGVLGAVCLLLALYAFSVLPISYAGLGLLLLGIVLMTAEAFAPSFGILGVGGIAAFIVGSIMLMDTELPGYQIAMPMIAGFAAFSIGMLVFVLGMIIRARHQAVVTGLDHLLGARATVESVEDEGDITWVRLDGELWQVSCADQLSPNDQVIVQAIDGLTLLVSRDNRGAKSC